jgi:hydroxypyruvate isomerase
MLRLSANISTLFTELPPLQRPAAAAAAGFAAIEMQFPYAWPLHELAAACRAAAVEVVLINMPPGDLVAGELGFACIPGRQDEFAESLQMAIEAAQLLQCPRVHCLAGKLPPAVPRQAAWNLLVENLRFAAGRLKGAGIQLLSEPLNAVDQPGFILTRIEEGDRLLEAVGHRNLALQYDIYHRRVAGDDWLGGLEPRIGRIGHIQFSDYPGRHQPGSGELDIAQLFALIEELPYAGWTGAEYKPTAATADSFGWLEPLRSRAGIG